MDCSLSGGASRYLDVLYEEYDRFDVQQTTVGVDPEEIAALEDLPDGTAVRIRVESESGEGVLALPDGDDRPMLGFETLTWAPIDRRLVLADRLAPWERAWLDGYHAEVLDRIGPHLPDDTRAWLAAACAPI